MTIDFSAHIISVSVSCIVHLHNVKYTRSRFILQCVVVSYNMSIDDLSDVYIPVTDCYVQGHLQDFGGPGYLQEMRSLTIHVGAFV